MTYLREADTCKKETMARRKKKRIKKHKMRSRERGNRRKKVMSDRKRSVESIGCLRAL